MISRIKLQNFQSHRDSEILFHPGITVVTGESDVGKSSVVRGLEWVAMSRPSGDTIRRHKTKTTTVDIDGVTKTRTASKHSYTVGGETFKALRTDVPEQVRNKLRLSDANFQRQHDTYFLISDKPGQVAKTLNEVADLKIIDTSLKEVRRRIRETKTEKKFLESQIKEKKETTKDLQWAIAADKDYTTIENLRLVAELIDTSSLEEKINASTTCLQELDKIPEPFLDVLKVMENLQNLKEDLTLQNAIDAVIENSVKVPNPKMDLKELEELMKVGGKSAEELEIPVADMKKATEDLDRYPTTVDDPKQTLDRLFNSTVKVKELEDLVNEILISEDCLVFAETEYTEGQVQFEDRKKEMGVCPLCEGKL